MPPVHPRNPRAFALHSARFRDFRPRKSRCRGRRAQPRRHPRPRLFILTALLLCIGTLFSRGEMPDISSVAPDLSVPVLADGPPGPGRRVRVGDPSGVYHVLYLPEDWVATRRWPVLVEYAGNGNYRNRFGDESRGRPEGSCLGYGLSGGRGFLWLCLPYLNGEGTKNVETWWGDAPERNVGPTVDYCIKTVASVCEEFSGDSARVVLSGFSRGAIATHFVGLQNERISALWRGFFAYSHFDGPSRWPYPGSDADAASLRFARARGRAHFVCGEEANAVQTRTWLEGRYGAEALRAFTFATTGFRNHNDAWILRPSEARDAARLWLAETIR